MLWTAPLHCRLHGHLPGCVETSRSPGYLRLGRVRVESWMRSLAISEVISEVFCLAQQKCKKKVLYEVFDWWWNVKPYMEPWLVTNDAATKQRATKYWCAFSKGATKCVKPFSNMLLLTGSAPSPSWVLRRIELVTSTPISVAASLHSKIPMVISWNPVLNRVGGSC